MKDSIGGGRGSSSGRKKKILKTYDSGRSMKSIKNICFRNYEVSVE
jgi:hypothetical protein